MSDKELEDLKEQEANDDPDAREIDPEEEALASKDDPLDEDDSEDLRDAVLEDEDEENPEA